jgi:transposase InsO family protein
LFAIDACDREAIAWSATTAGISGEIVRDLMIVCVERRFWTSKTPHVVKWLSDNGSAYIAKDTLDTATALGLQLCFTPVRSATVIALLAAWFEDYNEVHPHSGLKFPSPGEFLGLSA